MTKNFFVTADDQLVPNGLSPVLAPLETRVPLYRLGSSTFASRITTTRSSTVLDCRPRDSTAFQIYIQLFNAINLSERLPPHRNCTHETRTIFNQWLHSVTHLQSVRRLQSVSFLDGQVFIVDSLPFKTGLLSNSFLQRVLKYIGKCGSQPKEIVFLEGGMEALRTSELASNILRLTLPVYVAAAQNKEAGKPGLFVLDRINDLSAIQQFCETTSTSCLINLSAKAEINNFKHLHVFNIGPQNLPIKHREGAVQLYQQIFDIVFKALAKRMSICFIDTQPGRGLASLGINNTPHKHLSAVAVALVEIGGLTVADATHLVRRRIQPPDFDAFFVAALRYLEKGYPDRMQLAIDCLSARFSPAGNKKVDAEEDQRLVENLLKGINGQPFEYLWQQIIDSLKMRNLSRQSIDNMVK